MVAEESSLCFRFLLIGGEDVGNSSSNAGTKSSSLSDMVRTKSSRSFRFGEDDILGSTHRLLGVLSSWVYGI